MQCVVRDDKYGSVDYDLEVHPLGIKGYTGVPIQLIEVEMTAGTVTLGGYVWVMAQGPQALGPCRLEAHLDPRSRRSPMERTPRGS